MALETSTLITQSKVATSVTILILCITGWQLQPTTQVLSPPLCVNKALLQNVATFVLQL